MLDLYKDIIIEHGLNPRNKYIMNDFTHFAEGFNPFCGDSFCVYLKISKNNVIQASFDGKGCSISTASASLMTMTIENKNISDCANIFNYLKDLLNDKETKEDFLLINVLSNVKKFPSRIKCATLVWHIMQDAIKNGKK